MRTDATNNIQFRAIKVKKLEPVSQCSGVIFYNNATAMLEKPKPLFDGARDIINVIYKNIHSRNHTILDELDINRLLDMLKYISQDFSSRTLLGILGTGMYTTALLLDKNEVLCLSSNMEVFKKRKFEDFDLPIKSSGVYPKDIYCGWYIRNLGAPVSQDELDKLAFKIREKGYNLTDWRTEQACRVGKKLYLLDFECAERIESKKNSPNKNEGTLKNFISKFFQLIQNMKFFK